MKEHSELEARRRRVSFLKVLIFLNAVAAYSTIRLIWDAVNGPIHMSDRQLTWNVIDVVIKLILIAAWGIQLARDLREERQEEQDAKKSEP